MKTAGHTYYLAASRRVVGPRADDGDVRALLFATYLREVGVAGEVGRYDGASDCGMIVVGCHGAGTGRVIRAPSISDANSAP